MLLVARSHNRSGRNIACSVSMTIFKHLDSAAWKDTATACFDPLRTIVYNLVTVHGSVTVNDMLECRVLNRISALE
jgi:hypothetical protein